jgi:NAD(P)-dependent dehydrogenase (short-subunit alcohol dehydrogenase family)
VIDVADPESVARATGQLVARKEPIDLVLLNAGMQATTLVRNADGAEARHAASVVGHHQLTMGLLDAGLLSGEASIVIAGSEAALGDVPSFRPTDLSALADSRFDGDLARAAEIVLRNGTEGSFSPNAVYANAMLFVAWWAASVSRRGELWAFGRLPRLGAGQADRALHVVELDH